MSDEGKEGSKNNSECGSEDDKKSARRTFIIANILILVFFTAFGWVIVFTDINIDPFFDAIDPVMRPLDTYLYDNGLLFMFLGGITLWGWKEKKDRGDNRKWGPLAAAALILWGLLRMTGVTDF
jgi:hypothetical protein